MTTIFNRGTPGGSQKNQPVLDALRREIAELKHENDELKAENKRLGANATPGVQMRKCVNCSRDLPDGPSFYPGYLQPMGKNTASEAKRHHCVYCQLHKLPGEHRRDVDGRNPDIDKSTPPYGHLDYVRIKKTNR